MSKLILLRHGETLGNVQNGFPSGVNFLTLKGTRQAEIAGFSLLRSKIDLDHMISSDMIRAKQTASIVMQLFGELRLVEADKRLNELDKGNLLDGYPRVVEVFNDRLLSLLETGNVLCVSHYFTMQTLFDIMDMDRDNIWCKGRTVPPAIPFVYDTVIKQWDIYNHYRKDDHSLYA